MYRLMAVVLCVAKICESKLEPISEEQINRRLYLKDCLVEARQLFFSSNNETITYCMPMTESPESALSPVVLDRYLLPGLSQDNRISYIIKNLSNPNYSTEDTNKPDVYIIQIRRQEEVLASLQKLRQVFSWNPRAKFLVISPTVFDKPHKVAQEASKNLWAMNVLNAIVMLPKNETYYRVYTWHPYRNGNCGNNFTNTYVVDSCSFGVIKKKTSWFTPKLPKQFNKCVVKVRHFNLPPYAYSTNSSVKTNGTNRGIEVNIVNMIADVLNLTIAYSTGEMGEISENHTLFGDFRFLGNRTADLVIGGYAKTFKRSLVFDVGRSYIQESLIWCVPHIPIISNLENMINIISLEIWMLIISTHFLMSCLIWYCSCGKEDEPTAYKSFVSCSLNLFVIIVGSAPNILPKTARVRFLMGLFILYSYNIDSMYTSHLTSMLATPAHEETYTSVKDIYTSNLKTYFRPEDERYFESRSSDSEYLLNEIKKRWLNCSNVQKCLERVAFDKDSSFLLPKLHKDYVLNNASLGKLNCLKEIMVVYPVNMIMRKGFPLFPRFDDILYRIISSGFIAKWEDEVLQDRYKKSSIGFITFDTVRIKFKYLKSVFELFLICNGLCFIVFVIELVYYKRKMEIHMS